MTTQIDKEGEQRKNELQEAEREGQETEQEILAVEKADQEKAAEGLLQEDGEGKEEKKDELWTFENLMNKLNATEDGQDVRAVVNRPLTDGDEEKINLIKSVLPNLKTEAKEWVLDLADTRGVNLVDEKSPPLLQLMVDMRRQIWRQDFFDLLDKKSGRKFSFEQIQALLEQKALDEYDTPYSDLSGYRLDQLHGKLRTERGTEELIKELEDKYPEKPTALRLLSITPNINTINTCLERFAQTRYKKGVSETTEAEFADLVNDEYLPELIGEDQLNRWEENFREKTNRNYIDLVDVQFEQATASLEEMAQKNIASIRKRMGEFLKQTEASTPESQSHSQTLVESLVQDAQNALEAKIDELKKKRDNKKEKINTIIQKELENLMTNAERLNRSKNGGGVREDKDGNTKIVYEFPSGTDYLTPEFAAGWVFKKNRTFMELIDAKL